MADFQVGIIGCGNISTAYLQLAPLFHGYKITAVADINDALAKEQAQAFGAQAQSVDQLLANPDIDLVVNLTVPKAHFDVSQRILQAKKHVYSEKPYVLSVNEGKALLLLAQKNGVRVGSAPDTYLGGAHQAARLAIDDGLIGDVIGGSCRYQSAGMEDWHPHPDFFFQRGGGPVLDMGPYYISNLVQMLGPVVEIAAMGSKGYAERVIKSEPRAGERLPVEVDTNLNALLEFEQGAQITFTASWDVQSSQVNAIELFGTVQILQIPDPNRFGGVVKCCGRESESVVPCLPALSMPNFDDLSGEKIANYRGIGLADMVAAIHENRPHRCSGEMALHVIDVLTGILDSANSRQFVKPSTRCERPAALTDAMALDLLAEN